MTEEHLGMEAPVGFVQQMPPFVRNVKVAGEFLISSEKTYSEVAYDADCEDFIVCRVWEDNADWVSGYIDVNLPCSYLVFDVCDGTFACECSNGYQMRTDLMPWRSGDPIPSTDTDTDESIVVEELIDNQYINNQKPDEATNDSGNEVEVEDEDNEEVVSQGAETYSDDRLANSDYFGTLIIIFASVILLACIVPLLCILRYILRRRNVKIVVCESNMSPDNNHD